MGLEEFLPFLLLAIPIAPIVYVRYLDRKITEDLVDIIRSRGKIEEGNYLSEDQIKGRKYLSK